MYQISSDTQSLKKRKLGNVRPHNVPTPLNHVFDLIVHQKREIKLRKSHCSKIIGLSIEKIALSSNQYNNNTITH